jgi:hypothetical protein
MGSEEQADDHNNASVNASDPPGVPFPETQQSFRF